MIIQIAGVVVFIIIVLLYYQFFERPKQKIQETLEQKHFDVIAFEEDTKIATFKYVGKFYGQRLVVLLVLLGIAIILPARTLYYPLNLLMNIMGGVLTATGIAMSVLKGQQDEIKAAQNKAFGFAYVRYPGAVDKPHFMRRMEYKGRVDLDDTQREHLVEETANSILDLEAYKDSGLKKKQIKEIIAKKIENADALRYLVSEKYWILIVTTSTHEKLVSQSTTKVIDRTIEVEAQLMPLWMVYGGVGKYTYETKSDKGEIEYQSRRMGVFLDIYDLVRLFEDTSKGGYTAPDMLTQLLGEVIHVHQQGVWSASKMTQKERELEKALIENELAEWGSEASANKQVGAAKNLVELLHALLRPKMRTKTDWAMMIMLSVIAVFIGYMLAVRFG